KTQQAAANLAVRSQELEHDRELAKILAQLATQQQQARETIASAAEELRKPPGDSSGMPIAAAQSLLKAQERFVQAQAATGAGAAEVSGQQEVANQPIREGLERASRLGAGQEKGQEEKGQGDKTEEARGQGDKGRGGEGDAKSEAKSLNQK